MMAALAALALRAGVPQRFAKAAGIAAIAILFITLLAIGKCTYDRSVITKHNAGINAEVATKGREGEAAASVERRADDARIQNESQEVNDAVAPIPDRATSARQRARACVLLRRQAAAAGRPVPTC